MSMRRSSTALLAFTTAFAVTAAEAVEVTPDLRERAIQACTGDAERLCPEALLDEGRVVACMAGKRPQLSVPCRHVYDEVARATTR